MILTLHHTCKKNGIPEQILSEMPFLSEHVPEIPDKRPFLSEGYYFWEYNIPYAKYWGRQHYDNIFYIVECNVEINLDDDEYLLDLVGSRKQLCCFVDLLKEFELITEFGTKDIDLCSIIHYLRNQCPNDVFPFKVIRAVDYRNDNNIGIKIAFTDKKDNKSFTMLNPRYIISYKDKQDIVYSNDPFITFAS